MKGETPFAGPREEPPAGSMIDLSQIGQPTPNGWQVQQVSIGGEMFVKIIIVSPTGFDVHFMSGDQAELLASNLKRAGRAVKAGIWAPGGERRSAPQRPNGGGQGTDPSSPSTSRSGGQ